MIIQCTRYKAVQNGTFIGYADFLLPEIGIEIFGCTLHKKDTARWVNLPVRAYKDAEGSKKFSPIVRFNDQKVFHDFCTKAKEAIDSFTETKGEPNG